MLSSRSINLVAHVVGWLFFFALIIAFVYSSHRNDFDVTQLLSVPLIVFFLLYIGLFYLNTAVLFPKLYLQKNYGIYIGILLILCLLVLYFKPFDNLVARPYDFMMRREPPFSPRGQFGHPRGPRRGGPGIDIVSIVLFLMIISLSTVSGLMRQWRESEKKAAKAEADKAQAELSFLKAQINPHFLFNTLNNIYALTVTKNELAPEAVMKLANIMRYVTDEVSEDFVPLDKELACAKDYVALQSIRLNEKADIDFKITGKTEGKKIAPLIFMSFIENSFKYGISSHEASPIIIHIDASENMVVLFCRNKIFSNATTLKRSGVGIANTRQRLDYLYPNNHLLNITQENGLYTVQLTVQT